jgi:preprotein translocase subunit SecG
MAIALLTPTIARSRAAVISGSTRVVLRLVPELRVEAGEEIQLRAFMTILAGIFMASLIALLVINTSLNQDAFVLQRLKHQMNTVNDQRDAILRQAAIAGSPVTLSAAALKMGMIPNATPSFLEISSGPK